MEDSNFNKYEILQGLALAGSRGEDITTTAERALRQAAELVGLEAAAMFLWNEQMEVTLRVLHAGEERLRSQLEELENDLFADLRRDRKLLSAYLSFQGDPPIHSFSMPLSHRSNVFGAVIGLQSGQRTIVGEDIFLEALAAAIALNVLAGDTTAGAAGTAEQVEAERLGAIIETAVTVNHEINNPLTAILGNIQLLLMKGQDLDEETARKLRVVEQSALKIRDVTQRLLKITNTRTVTYVEGTNMLHLPEDDEDSGGDATD